MIAAKVLEKDAAAKAARQELKDAGPELIELAITVTGLSGPKLAKHLGAEGKETLNPSLLWKMRNGQRNISVPVTEKLEKLIESYGPRFITRTLRETGLSVPELARAASIDIFMLEAILEETQLLVMSSARSLAEVLENGNGEVS